MNFFNTIDEVLNPDIASKIALYVDEPTEKSRKATEALIYIIYGGLLKRTTTEIGVDQLYNKIKKGHYDGNLVASITNTLKDAGQTHAIITTGNEDISHLLPALKSSIGNLVSRYANIRNSSAISLLGLLTALTLDILGRHVREKNLDADGLATYLHDQRDAFINLIPEALLPELIDKLSLQQIVAGAAAPAKRISQVAASSGRTATTTRTIPTTISYEPDPESADGGNSLAKWGIGILLLVVVAGGGYFIWKNTQSYSDGSEEVNERSILSGDTIQADTVARSLAVPVAPGTKPASATPGSTTGTAATPPGGTTAAGGPLSAQLAPYLSNPAAPKGRVFNLTSVGFLPGTLNLNPASQATIAELVTVLKNYPNAQIQLVGYANDASAAATGLTNMDLSRKRAYAIKQQLLNAGIDNNRVDAVGRGTGVTYTPGDSTAVRRPTLRKIDMRVVLK